MEVAEVREPKVEMVFEGPRNGDSEDGGKRTERRSEETESIEPLHTLHETETTSPRTQKSAQLEMKFRFSKLKRSTKWRSRDVELTPLASVVFPSKSFLAGLFFNWKMCRYGESRRVFEFREVVSLRMRLYLGFRRSLLRHRAQDPASPHSTPGTILQRRPFDTLG